MKNKCCEKIIENRWNIVYFLCIQLIGIVYYFFLGDEGPYLMRDSEAFMHPEGYILRNYWLYTNFVSVCRIIAGEKYYLLFIYIMQSIFALIVSWSITKFFRSFYKMNYFESALIYVMTLLPYGYSLPENVVTHHILTEGLAIPLFQFCLLYCIRLFLERHNKNIIIILIVSIFLVLTRPQLLVVVPVLVILFMVYFIKKSNKHFVKTIFLSMATLLITAFGFLMFLMRFTCIEDQLYAAISGRVLCTMEYEDRDLFYGELQEIFDDVYKTLDEGKHLDKYFRKDSWRSFDIGYHTNENTKNIVSIIRTYYNNKHSDQEGNSYLLQSYYDRNAIVKTLFLNHIGKYFSMTVALIVESMVVGVFIQPDAIRNLCYIFTGMIYLFLIILYMYSTKILKVDFNYLIPLKITMLFLGVNIVLTNIIFYGQQRYVIYTFGMFYISIFMLFVGIYRKKRKVNKWEN